MLNRNIVFAQTISQNKTKYQDENQELWFNLDNNSDTLKSKNNKKLYHINGASERIWKRNKKKNNNKFDQSANIYSVILQIQINHRNRTKVKIS